MIFLVWWFGCVVDVLGTTTPKLPTRNCTCFSLSNPLFVEFPIQDESDSRRIDMYGLPCVVRHGALPQGAPELKTIRCERDSEGKPHPTSFTEWRCYPQPAMHSRFAFNYTFRCLMLESGKPYTNDPLVHAKYNPKEVCCSLRYSIRLNDHWIGMGLACLIQISFVILISSVILMFQYVDRSSHPLTRLIKERWFFAKENLFPDTSETGPLSVAVSIPMAYECAPLAFVCAYVMFNLIVFVGAVMILISMPYITNLLLISATTSLIVIFLFSTCSLMILVSRFNSKTYQWIKQATKKRTIPRKPDFDFSNSNSEANQGFLNGKQIRFTKKNKQEEETEEQDIV